MAARFATIRSLIGRHAAAMHGARSVGYLYQLLAMARLDQPAVAVVAAAADAGPDGPRRSAGAPVNGQILAGLIPNAELRMIDDGHLFMVTRPAETAAVIEAFLAGEGGAVPVATESGSLKRR